VANQQQHPRRFLAGLGLLDLGLQIIELLAVTCGQFAGLPFSAEQAAQMREVLLHCAQFGFAGEQLNSHTGVADLCQHRRRAHFLGTYQHIGAQAENALGRQLTLVTDAGQSLERLWVLAGGVDANQALLAAQGADPFAQGATGTHPTLRQLGGQSLGGENKTGAQGDQGSRTAHHRSSFAEDKPRALWRTAELRTIDSARSMRAI